MSAYLGDVTREQIAISNPLNNGIDGLQQSRCSYGCNGSEVIIDGIPTFEHTANCQYTVCCEWAARRKKNATT